jgi:nitric oxide synthase-interacting protein
MTRHSKNNSAGAIFSHAEKEKLGIYGKQKVRVGKDSMLDHNACKLCLQEARVPQVCNKGHLFCRV